MKSTKKEDYLHCDVFNVNMSVLGLSLVTCCFSDVHSAVTLTVSPDRVQHFTSDSVSLSCEGNSTDWRVKSFPKDGYSSYCSNWRSNTGSTCNIYTSQQRDAVYWCESGSGEFSNAVNITTQSMFSLHFILFTSCISIIFNMVSITALPV